MTVILNVPPERAAALRASIARHDAEAVGRILLEAPSSFVDQLGDEDLLDVSSAPMSMEEYDRYVEEMDAELASIFGPDAPELSDYAVSREGIYENYPPLN